MRKLFEKRIIVVRYLLCWSVTIIFAFQNLAHHTVNNLLVPPVLMVVGVLASLVKITHPWGYFVLGLCYAVQVVLMSTLWSVPEIFPWIVCVSEICMVECISITWGLEKEANKLVLYILIIIQVASRKVWALTDALRSEVIHNEDDIDPLLCLLERNVGISKPDDDTAEGSKCNKEKYPGP